MHYVNIAVSTSYRGAGGAYLMLALEKAARQAVQIIGWIR